MPRVMVPRYAALCRLCRKELSLVPQNKGGIVTVEMRCPKHGVLKDGDRYCQSYMLEVDENEDSENRDGG
jgi:uncharacterized radical SAM superfamily Fe-S cluster-containing enzyme